VGPPAPAAERPPRPRRPVGGPTRFRATRTPGPRHRRAGGRSSRPGRPPPSPGPGGGTGRPAPRRGPETAASCWRFGRGGRWRASVARPGAGHRETPPPRDAPAAPQIRTDRHI